MTHSFPTLRASDLSVDDPRGSGIEDFPTPDGVRNPKRFRTGSFWAHIAISSRNNRERGKANKYCRCISFQHRDDLEVEPGQLRFGDCPRKPWISIARDTSTKRRHGPADSVMPPERPTTAWR